MSLKTYKEYYQIAQEQHLAWKSIQQEEWWKKGSYKGDLELRGEYLETATLIPEDEKNDSSIFENHTNVKNSEWNILFSMLGRALVEWCVENERQEDLWSFSIKVKRVVDGIENLYIPSFNVRHYNPDTQLVENIEDESRLEGFVGCQDFLLGLISEFLERNGRDIPLDWNGFWFGLDDLRVSCRYGDWVGASDGYMNLASVNDESKDSKIYVRCM